MNRSIESALRFVNLTAAGLLAGSLGFGEAALVPGWQDERAEVDAKPAATGPFNAIGPVALATSLTLAIASRQHSSVSRSLDVLSTLGLAGVLAATTLVTVPLNRELLQREPVDYPQEESETMARNWDRAHAVRTALGISAFVCAVASSIVQRPTR